MQDSIEETFRQAEAKLAELRASPQGQKLAEWDERFGRVIAFGQAAAWTIAACIAASMARLVMAAVDGGYEMAAAVIGVGMVLMLMWRARRAVRQKRTVSGMMLDEAGAQLGPARMVLGVAQLMRGKAR